MKRIITLSFILLLSSVIDAQWVREKPTLASEDFDNIRKITYVDSSNGWLITSYRLFHTTDGGQSWKEQIVIQPLSDKSFSEIKFFDSQNGVLVNKGDLYKSSDGGNSWRMVSYSPVGYQFLSSSVWFKFSNNSVYKTINGGLSWAELTNFDWLANLYFYDSSTGYAYGRKNSGENFYMYYTNDGGLTWNRGNITGISNYTFITNMQFTSRDIGYAIVPDSLRIIKTIDGGKTWVMKNLAKIHISDWLGTWRLKFFNDLIGFISIPPPYTYPDGTILRTLDGGETWEKYPAYGIGIPNDIFYSPVPYVTPDITTAILSARQSFLKANLVAPIRRDISILSPTKNESFRSGKQILLKWENNSKQSVGELVCVLYKIDNSYSISTISTDTVNISQTELMKKVSVDNESDVTNSLFYRIYNPNDINSEDVSEKFFVRIPPKITLVSITNSGYVFIDDSLTINFKTYAVDKIKIQYSTNGGTDWLDISNTIQSDSNQILSQNYKWLIPSTSSDNCLLRIISLTDPNVYVVSSPFKIAAQKEIAMFPLKKGNAWFYKLYHYSYGDHSTYAPNNIYYIVRTGDEILKEDGYKYFPFYSYLWDRNSGDANKFDYNSTGYYRQYQNKIYSYGSSVARYDLSAQSKLTKVFNRELKTFRYGTDLQWEIVADSIGLIEFGNTAPVYGGWYARDYLVSAIINGVVYGDTSKVTGILKDNDQIPTNFSLSQNYPNPFNPTTTIEYQVPKQSRVVVRVMDLLGREIETLVNEEKTAGKYSVKFNGSNCASGVYFYQLIANGNVITKKFVLMK